MLKANNVPQANQNTTLHNKTISNRRFKTTTNQNQNKPKTQTQTITIHKAIAVQYNKTNKQKSTAKYTKTTHKQDSQPTPNQTRNYNQKLISHQNTKVQNLQTRNPTVKQNKTKSNTKISKTQRDHPRQESSPQHQSHRILAHNIQTHVQNNNSPQTPNPLKPQNRN